METEIFFNYMLNHVIPSLGTERPQLMVYDGHVTHVDERVVALAAENGLIILKLPAHTSHLLQPLDLAVFKSFKSIWDVQLVTWQRENIGIKVRKQAFARKFAEAWHKTKPEVIRNGFKKGGIYS
ncbi:jg14192 [Pararge aegeria aegeria]|uniref:Jg14192 protein n=1 Tax=Pararge aegeria aegeria TaxID=348720 RepID=A0A8S4R184_9NEOP|nr:jg14192 [Pararge aegeria aegeria]